MGNQEFEDRLTGSAPTAEDSRATATAGSSQPDGVETKEKDWRDRFRVAEYAPAGKVAAGTAASEEDRFARRKVATAIYLKRGYLTAGDSHLNQDGTYIDEWEQQSVPLVAKLGSEVTASMRIIYRTNQRELPIVHEQITIDPHWQTTVDTAQAELSQLAKSDERSADQRPAWALYRTYFQIAKQAGFQVAVAVIDNRVRRYMNGNLNFNLITIGPEVDYMGSLCTPVAIDYQAIIRNVRSGPAGVSGDLADFFDGQNAKGFEWYLGP
jgi:hypothetical protein